MKKFRSYIMRKIILISLLNFISYVSLTQNISIINTEMQQETIHVWYKITDASFNQYFKITIYLSDDDGNTFIPLKETEGDIGKIEGNGYYQIIWHFAKEKPFKEADFIFDIKAEVFEIPLKRSFLLNYTGNRITPLGFRIGLIGKTSPYLEARMSLININTDYYTYEDSTIKDYDKLAYYEFTDYKGYSALYLGAGINYQRNEVLHLYFGAGYYLENFLYQINEFYYNSQQSTKTYVKDTYYSTEGLELNYGIILKYNKFIITGGLTNYAFGYEDFFRMSFTAGIGFCI